MRADQLAAGYRCVHYGVLAPRSAAGERALLRVPRLSEEYLLTLQGSSRVTPWSVWRERVARFAAKGRGALS